MDGILFFHLSETENMLMYTYEIYDQNSKLKYYSTIFDYRTLTIEYTNG